MESFHWPKRRGKYEINQSNGELLKFDAVA